MRRHGPLPVPFIKILTLRKILWSWRLRICAADSDKYLTRLRDAGDRQRGLLILDNSSHETSLQRLANEFRAYGTRWGIIRNLADTPFFVDSRASRLVQLADHVAYAVFRRYNASDTQYFDIIAAKFDSADGVLHGLSHKQNNNPSCMCPACMSRRAHQADFRN